MAMQDHGNLLEIIAKDTVEGGRFTFSDTTSCTKKVLLVSQDKGFPSNWLEVWISPGKRTCVSGKNKLICVWKVEGDIPEQQEANAFQACAGDLRTESTKLEVQESDWLKRLNGEAENDEAIWKEVNTLRETSFPLKRELFKKEIDYMQTAPIGPVWLERLKTYAQMSPIKQLMPYTEELKTLYNRLSNEQKQTPAGKVARQYLYPTKTVNVGDEMVDADLYDVNGRVHHLTELKGKYILLDFWSQGCAPCIESLSELKEISESYSEILEVVSISLDPEKMWKKYVNEKQLSGYQWNELAGSNTNLTMCYQVKGYPHYVLITPNGRIKATWGGYGKGSLKQRMKKELN